jgi:hypothetical protein
MLSGYVIFLLIFLNFREIFALFAIIFGAARIHFRCILRCQKNVHFSRKSLKARYQVGLNRLPTGLCSFFFAPPEGEN